MRSRESSLCRIEIALLMAACSAARSVCLSFHSSFFSARDAVTCLTYSVSSVTCCLSASCSCMASILDIPLAPFSTSIRSSASCAADFCSPLVPMSLSNRAWVSSSFFVASWRFAVKDSSSFASVPWILEERAL